MKLIALTALLLPMSALAEAPPVRPAVSPDAPPAERTRTLEPLESAQMPNAYPPAGTGCLPLVQQVTGEDKEYPPTRLDRQPPAKLLFAVDRHVNGCREVTFVHGRDRARAIGGRR